MNTKKILIVNVTGIGDFIESVSTLESIRKKYNDSQIVMLVSSKVYEYAKDCPYVNEVFEIKTAKAKGFTYVGLPGLFLLAIKLRKRQFDMAINLYEISDIYGSLRMKILFKFIAPKLSIGRDTEELGSFFDKRAPERVSDKKNRTDYFKELAILAGVEKIVENPDFWVSENDKKIAEDIFSSLDITDKTPIIGIAPGGERETRHWFPDRFAKVADILVDKYNAKIVIFGGKSEIKLAEEIKKKMTVEPLILAGKTTIGSLILLLKRCTLLIAIDSALMHIAGNVGTHLVGIFGPENPIRAIPDGNRDKITFVFHKVDCNPCYYNKCPKQEKLCMTLITVDEILAKAVELMQRFFVCK
jgi:heptosyltransferase-2